MQNSLNGHNLWIVVFSLHTHLFKLIDSEKIVDLWIKNQNKPIKKSVSNGFFRTN